MKCERGHRTREARREAVTCELRATLQGVIRYHPARRRENGGGSREKMFCVDTKRLIRPPTHPDTPTQAPTPEVRIDGTRNVSARFRSTIWKYPFGATQRARVEAGDGVSLAIPNKHHCTHLGYYMLLIHVALIHIVFSEVLASQRFPRILGGEGGLQLPL